MQNFLAGAAGLAVGVAFVRGLARDRAETLGNFWVDLVRSILWVLLPLSIVGALVLAWQGVPMNFHSYTQAVGLDGSRQTIAQGPVAALEIIKNLGTNGGGFFNANGAHPYENPTPLANLIEMLAIAVLPAAFTHTYGLMVGRPRHGWVLYRVMIFLFTVGLLICGWAEQHGNPLLPRQLNTSAGAAQAGGNMEGKEVRFGITTSVLTAVTTSNGATGSYNSMHDSYTPIGGMVPLINMLLGEMILGGLGTGIYSIIMVALVALFLAGLMIGRTPAYLGKRIRAAESKMIMLYILAGSTSILHIYRAGGSDQRRSRRSGNQPWHARFHGNPVCLHFGQRQQRPELCRPERKQHVLQLDYCDNHDGGTLRTNDTSARPSRPLCRPAARSRECRHTSHELLVVCHPAHFYRADCVGTQLLPGAGARATAGTSDDDAIGRAG